jgi:hypothetical protein
VVLRKNYEGRFADHTNDPDPRKRLNEMKQGRKGATAATENPASVNKSKAQERVASFGWLSIRAKAKDVQKRECF